MVETQANDSISNNNNTPMEPSNPYYIHPSDHPGHVLVPEKLNGVNYHSWNKSMKHALTAKNKFSFVDGSIKPPSEIAEPKKYAIWNQCKSMILSWLAHSVEPSLSKGVVHTKTAQQVWENFKDLYSQNNAPTIYQIQEAIARHSQKDMSVAAYYSELKGYWDELDIYRTPPTCNQMKEHNDQLEEDQMIKFLMSLNDSYQGVRSNILMMKPLPNIRQAYSIVTQEETQRQMTSGSTENFSIVAAVQNRSDNFKTKHCDHCDRDGHTIENCRTRKFHCTYCDRRGHTEERCKFKTGTWVPNNGGNQTNGRSNQRMQQQSRGSHMNGRQGTFSTANAIDTDTTNWASSSSALPNPLQGLSTEQLQ